MKDKKEAGDYIMKKIFCLMEDIDNEAEKYINSLDDNEVEIHVYDSIIESC